jgi:hypothetical protein
MAEAAARLWVGPSAPFVPPPNPDGTRDLNPEDPGSLHYTHIIQGNLGQTRVSNWRDLLDFAVRTASQKSVPFSSIQQIAAARDQDPSERSFHQVEGTKEGTKIWVRAMDANQCWQRSFRLAQQTGVEIYVLIEWEDTEGAANPGQKARLQWSPPASANVGPQ